MNSNIEFHQNLYVIKSISVVIDDLHVMSSDNRLFGFGGNSYKVLGVENACNEMTEILIDRPNDIQIIEVYPSYIASYVMLGRPNESMNLFKILKRDGFVDIDIKLG